MGDILWTVLIVLEAVISLLLIGIILIQKTKGGGLGVAFGSGAGESLFGSRAGNILTRGTIILAVAFMINTLVLTMIYRAHGSGGSVVEAVPRALPGPATPVVPVSGPAPAGMPGPAPVAPAAPAQ